MKLSLAEAYSTLEIQHGSTVDEARSAYRKLALIHHPDKNEGSEESTVMFQRVSSAYERIQAHHAPPDPRAHPGGGGGGGGMGNFSFSSGFGRPPGFGFGPFGGGGGFTFFGPAYRPGMAGGQFDAEYARSRQGGGGGYYQEESDEYDEEEDYDDDYEDEDEDGGYGRGGPDFFSFMFSDILNGGYGSRQSYRQQHPETEAQKAKRQQDQRDQHERARKKAMKDREDALAAEERRQKEAEMDKERKEKEREAERNAGATRREDKAARKRQAAIAEKELADKRALERLQAAQAKRSAVFAAARKGDSAAVKKGVWEDSVGASDGQWLPGMEPVEEVKVEVAEEEMGNKQQQQQTNGATAKGKGKGKKSNGGGGGDAKTKEAEKENLKNSTPAPTPKAPTPAPTPAPSTNGSTTQANGGGGGGGGGKKKNKNKKKGGAAQSNPPPASTSSTTTAVNSPVVDCNSTSDGKFPSDPPKNPSPSSSAPKSQSKASPKIDPKETLLHIAVKNGDEDLTKWLCNHGALPEERDSLSFTAFHHSLQLGHLPIVLYFLEEYPLDSTPDSAYPPPPGETLLSLAVTSGKSQVVEAVLQESEAEDVAGNWEWVEEVMKGPGRGEKEKEEWEEVKWVLAGKEGFTPPEGYRRRRRPASVR